MKKGAKGANEICEILEGYDEFEQHKEELLKSFASGKKKRRKKMNIVIKNGA